MQPPETAYRKQMRRLLSEVRAILLEDWDPLGVGDNPNLADEYDCALAEVMAAVGRARMWNDVAAKLCEIERDHFGMTGTAAAGLEPVALRLLELKARTPHWPMTGLASS